MKSSLTDTTAAALRGFAGWFSGRTETEMSDAEHVPFVVAACGYRPEERNAEGSPDSEPERDSWLPGLNVDNFS
ncbi:MAG: hypothetical protein JSR99_00485 [Proteobacteria bacterium]|nr:hypothetical protein [Pseudomonadota bacterium]